MRNPKMWFGVGGGLLLSIALLVNLPGAKSCSYPCVPGSEDIMKPKEHGTSHTPVQQNLRWGCDWDIADRICNMNRHYAEFSGSWKQSSFLNDIKGKKEVIFYDSNTGKPVFTAPKDRTWDDWIKESSSHGWPSFRDNEVNWDQVRILPNGETVSLDGTHLGHNLPDRKGNRFCINLVSIAGRPEGN
jgi:peptide methionine sulfoxide reductase MsrB